MKLRVIEDIPKTPSRSLHQILSDRNRSIHFIFDSRYYLSSDYFKKFGLDFSDNWDDYETFVKSFDGISDENLGIAVMDLADVIRDNYDNGMSGYTPIKYRKIDGLLNNAPFINKLISDCIYSSRSDYKPLFNKNAVVDALISDFANKLSNELYRG